MKIITYSLEERLNIFQKKSIQSLINNGYDVDLYTYNKNVTNLKVNIKNPEKIIKFIDIEKIIPPKIKNFYFKIKLSYHLGGIIIDPDVFCLKFYNFPENILISSSPDNQYLNTIPDYSIIKLPKKSKIMHCMVHHFFMLYNDFILEYNLEDNIPEILMNLIDKTFHVELKEWKFSNSCNSEDWKSQLGIHKNISENIITDINELQYFVKIWDENILCNLDINELNLQKNCLLGKLLR